MFRRLTLMLALLFASLGLYQPANAQQIDTSKLAQGFIMSFHPILDDATADKPRGRAIAALIYRDGFPVNYFKPFEMQSDLNKYRDRYWLLEFDGFLNLEEDGEYSFATTITYSDHARCGSELSLQGKSVAKIDPEWRDGPLNAYTDIALARGLYQIKLKFYCTKRNSKNVKPELELSMRGPRDPILKPFPARNVFYLRP